MFEWIVRLALLLVLLWWCCIQIRYFWRRCTSRGWPTTTATLQKGANGPVSVGRGAAVHAAFIGYGFVVEGVRRAGIFVLYGGADAVRAVQEKLAGASVDIRYDPSNPDISYLVDLHDSLFEGLEATQNPEWVSQAPEFHIKDTTR